MKTWQIYPFDYSTTRFSPGSGSPATHTRPPALLPSHLANNAPDPNDPTILLDATHLFPCLTLFLTHSLLVTRHPSKRHSTHSYLTSLEMLGRSRRRTTIPGSLA